MREITDKEIDAALIEAVKTEKANIPLYHGHCQNHSSVNNVYPVCENTQWTTGFYPGILSLLYEYTKEDCFKSECECFVESFYERILNKVEVAHHDMGFLYSPSCVSQYRLHGNEKARKAALLASDALMARFNEKGGFFQAWGEMGAKDNCRFIIDCLLNLPILYFASDETGDRKYREAALIHTSTCIAYSFRNDYSTYHTFFMDPETGEGLRGETCQGYSKESFWTRGQAWAVYGTALSYRHTKDKKLFDLFDGVLQFFLSKLPEDLVPYWDMIFTSGPEERDSSSASIVACGLLEMSKWVTDEEKRKYYISMAKKLLFAVYSTCAVKDSNNSNGLVLHGTYSKHSPYNTCTEEGVDECVSWGDYFYTEALIRLKNPNWICYW
jgi:Glycosyl Hydrolase Family 88.